MAAEVAPTMPTIKAESWSLDISEPIPEEVSYRSTGKRLKGLSPAERSQQQPMLATKLPETPSMVLPPTLSFVKSYGLDAQTMNSMHLRKEENLMKNMKSLKLGEHFDRYGKPSFRSLGLAFAAKHVLPKKDTSWGTVVEPIPATGSEVDSLWAARAFIQSQEEVQKDHKRWKQQALDLINSIPEHERYKEEDVKRRQTDIYFLEVPDFPQYLPPAVTLSTIQNIADLEPDLARNRYATGRANNLLEERGWLAGGMMGWRLLKSDVRALSEAANLWSVAAWPNGGAQVGMDRATFCRFILDIGIVDQRKVQFSWAVSLFDDMSHAMRCCSLEESLPQLSPQLPVVNRWELISVLDVLIEAQSRNPVAKSRFIRSLYSIAKLRLPQYALSGMTAARWAELTSPDAVMQVVSDQPSPGKLSRDKSTKKVYQSVVSTLDRDEAESRERRVNSMLVEPEVLQLLWQHEEIFRVLHRCYADDTGHMSSQALAQLASDFRLCPRFLPLNPLLTLYTCTQCLDMASPSEPSLPDLDEVSEFSGTTLRNPSKSRPGGPRSSSNSQQAQPQFTPRPPSQSRKPAMEKRSSRARRLSAASLQSSLGERRQSLTISNGRRYSRLNIPVERPTSGSSVMSMDSSKGGRQLAGSPRSISSALDASVKWPPALPWDGVMELVRRAEAGRSPISLPSKFGHNALMELLCKVAFNYLSFYGNMQQRSMTGFLQATWLLTHLRFVSSCLRKSFDKRGLDQETEEKRFGPLSRAVRQMPDELWQLGQLPQEVSDDHLPRETFQPLVQKTPASLGLLPTADRRDQELLPVGSPCVVDGKCRQCGFRAGDTSWGQITCYGCSRLDSLPLLRHPLSPLIFDRRPGYKPKQLEAAFREGQRPRRRSMTPPPLRDSDSLRNVS
eukprot:TRINITY_DN79466_c0_g1_i1.p1 TRINITY_DN79466_c0_g1~~TRINITY_DN79466_c0_g1_i1.p1  ORF type:complete len:900 (-),score=131.89 TRINITY_DN79466_c0_g1_i1:124-2823(-)